MDMIFSFQRFKPQPRSLSYFTYICELFTSPPYVEVRIMILLITSMSGHCTHTFLGRCHLVLQIYCMHSVSVSQANYIFHPTRCWSLTRFTSFIGGNFSFSRPWLLLEVTSSSVMKGDDLGRVLGKKGNELHVSLVVELTQ